MQLRAYHDQLIRHGLDVEISTALNPHLNGIDLVHLFNLDRPLETLQQARSCRDQGKPLLLSPIHHNPKHIATYQHQALPGRERLLASVVGSIERKEQLKSIYRSLRSPALRPLLKDQVRFRATEQQQEILSLVDGLLPIAKGELENLCDDFENIPAFSWLIPNGADPSFSNSPRDWNERNGAISVGRIEPRKNQLALAQALAGANFPVVFVGAPNPNFTQYYRSFMHIVNRSSNLYFTGRLPQEIIGGLYRAARVHILAGWFEVVPLVDLEAAQAGCAVVTTVHSYIQEFLGDSVARVDPGDLTSVRDIVEKSLKEPPDVSIYERAVNYTWERAGTELLSAYEALLTGSKSGPALGADIPPKVH